MRARRIELKESPTLKREEKRPETEKEKVYVVLNPQKNLRFLGWCFFAGGFVVFLLYAAITHWNIWKMMQVK